MLLVNDMYPAIQGEGVWTGRPMYLIRLHGCNVGCPFCDTNHAQDTTVVNNKETSFLEARGENGKFTVMQPEEVVAQVMQEWNFELVMITGGEPMLQGMDLEHLVRELGRVGYKCHLETSGTVPWDKDIGLVPDIFRWVTVSPKLKGKVPFIKDNLQHAHEVKWPIENESDIVTLMKLIQVTPMKKGSVLSLHPILLGDKYNDNLIQ